MNTPLRDTIVLLWRRRNSCDPRLRAIARELLREDLRTIRRTTRNPL
ncbi:MAG: hypothetical protein J7603_00085 [Pseudacidovorax sp.]|nr:hypothetical protein [Pseudacidovorax sp.]